MDAAYHAPILTFHALEAAADPICFPSALFHTGLVRLVAAGFRALPVEEIAASSAGDGRFPARAFALTFDDGYESVYRDAFPVLQKYGIAATVFVCPGNGRRSDTQRLPSICGRSMLSWPEIREMQKHGIRFGAHTLTHPDLRLLPPDRAEAEMRDSQSVLEDALGVPVRTFAYPFGRFNNVCREIACRYFDLACSDRLGLVAPAADPFTLPRVDAFYLRSERQFDTMLSPIFPWYVTARAVPRRLRRALNHLFGD